MFPSLSAGAEAPGRPGRRGPAPIWAAYGLLGVLLLGYLISLIVRPPGDDHTWLDGWGVCAFELIASTIAIGRGIVLRHSRAVCLTLGAAMSMWAIGDVALTYESLGGASPPTRRSQTSSTSRSSRSRISDWC